MPASPLWLPYTQMQTAPPSPQVASADEGVDQAGFADVGSSREGDFGELRRRQRRLHGGAGDEFAGLREEAPAALDRVQVAQLFFPRAFSRSTWRMMIHCCAIDRTLFHAQ